MFNRFNNDISDQGNNIIYYLFLCIFITYPLVLTLDRIYYIKVWGPLSLTQTVNGLILIILLFFSANKIFLKISFKFFAPLFLLFFYSLLITFFIDEPLVHLKETARMFFPILAGMTVYFLTIKNMIKQHILEGIAWWILLTYLTTQIISYTLSINMYDNPYSFGGFGGKGGSASLLVMITPIFFLSGKWRKLDILALTLTLFSAALTMRRSAILAILLTVLIGIFCRIIKNRIISKDLIYGILIVILTSSSFMYALKTTDWGEHFMIRIEDADVRSGGTGSGRTILNEIAFDHIERRDLIYNIFGEGRASMLRLTESSLYSRIGTHNELLTIVLSYGLLGMLLYTAFYLNILRLIYKLRWFSNGIFEALYAALSGLIVVALTAGETIIDPLSLPIFSFLGYAVAIYNMQIEQITPAYLNYNDYETSNIEYKNC